MHLNNKTHARNYDVTLNRLEIVNNISNVSLCKEECLFHLLEKFASKIITETQQYLL